MSQQLDTSGRDRGYDWGGVIFGVLLLGLGAYWLLKDTLKVDLPAIAWETVWPILLIALGGTVLFRAATGRERRRRRDV